MERRVGTISRGIRCPIIREGDPLADIVVSSVLEAAESEGFELRDRDVISVTESIVARAQGNYASVEAIAKDVKEKLGGETIGVIFPILSRNRFAVCLRGIAMGAKKVVLMLSYPSDEVGNSLVSQDQLDDAGINPYSDVLTLEKYRELFQRPDPGSRSGSDRNICQSAKRNFEVYKECVKLRYTYESQNKTHFKRSRRRARLRSGRYSDLFS